MENRFIRFGLKGAPDILAVVRGKLFGLEIKGLGDKQSVEQESWCHALEAAGGKYLLIDHIGWLNGKPDISATLDELRKVCE